ncbi:MAG: hypothetical protein AAFQ87_18245 [Bacteroidota bacterium]
MKEQNRDQLKAAIEQLPTYEAGPDIWDRLETALDDEQQEQDNELKLQVSTALLPTYEAPQSVWRKLERQLGGRKRSLWLSRIAASVLVLAMAGGITYTQWPAEKPLIVPEQDNRNPQLELPIAEPMGVSVMREQEAELLDCLEAREDWQAIHDGESFQQVLGLMSADSLDEAGFAERERLISTLREEYCQ